MTPNPNDELVRIGVLLIRHVRAANGALVAVYQKLAPAGDDLVTKPNEREAR